MHLAECACRSGNDVYEYLPAAFGVTKDSLNEFCVETAQLSDSLGSWPSFAFSHGSHTLIVDYLGELRHEVRYRHASEGLVTTWAKECGSFMLPGFRWEEIQNFSQRSREPAATLLLLLPSSDIPFSQRSEARDSIRTSFRSLGYEGPLISAFSDDIVTALVSDRNWFEDPVYGWVTDDLRSWRCRDRPASGLRIPDDRAFLALKSFTDAILIR